MDVLELFGGIGACSKALERLNIDFKIVDYVEINKYSVASFNAIHNTNFEPQDISKWDKDLKVDLIMHGSPCQDFSKAGRGAGGDKGSGTRSSLMYETIRIIEKLKPKYVIWENVTNLISKKHIHNFNNYLNTLEELGYTSYYKVLAANDYGIPQRRERIFTVSIRRDLHKYFSFPKAQPLTTQLKDYLESNVKESYFLTAEQTSKILFKNSDTAQDYLLIKNNTKKGYLEAYDGDGCYLNISTKRGTVQRGMIPTLKCGLDIGVVVNVNGILKIRKFTPKECWLLMGFDEADYIKASKVNKQTQLYKQAGNSIVVNVLEQILSNLLLTKCDQTQRQMSIYDYI